MVHHPFQIDPNGIYIKKKFLNLLPKNYLQGFFWIDFKLDLVRVPNAQNVHQYLKAVRILTLWVEKI